MTKSHVTKREAAAIVRYAGSVVALLRMPAWTIMVMEEPAHTDSEASVDWIDQRLVARIWLSSEWMKYDDDRRRNTITHEVLHLLHARVSTVALDDSVPYMHDHEHKDWARRVRRELELMVDQLAGFLATTHDLERAWTEAHTRDA